MRRTRFSNPLGRRVSKLLTEACLTQRQLARLMQLPYATVNQMITGRMTPFAGFEQVVQQAVAKHRTV